MDPVKTDNEGELTSTMDNVISVPSKDEKSDTSSDATPTSSTDANIRPAASHIALDDPISSTSSDNLDQLKVKMDKGNNASVNVHRVSTDNEADLLDISNITNNEKITEDVEDLVHDLESLLGESTDSFSVKSKFNKTDPSLRSSSGNSSNDTSLPKENSDVAVDNVLQELEELAGNVTPENATVSLDEDLKDTMVENTAPVESTGEKLEINSGIKISDVSDKQLDADQICSIDNSLTIEACASGSSNVVTNSEDLIRPDISETDATNTQSSNDPQDSSTEETTTSSIENTNQQGSLCIQDQDISHSEPKEKLENAESTTCEVSNEDISEDVPSKTDEVTSSEGNSNENIQSTFVEEKSDVTGSEEAKTAIHKPEEACNEEIASKESQDVIEENESIIENAETDTREDEEEKMEVSSEHKVDSCEVSEKVCTKDVLQSQEGNVNIDCKDEQSIETESKEVVDKDVKDEADDEIIEKKQNNDKNENNEFKKENCIDEAVDSTDSECSVPCAITDNKITECLAESAKNSVTIEVEMQETGVQDETDKKDVTETIIEKSNELESKHSKISNEVTDPDSCVHKKTEPIPSVLEPNSENPLKDIEAIEDHKNADGASDSLKEHGQITKPTENVSNTNKPIVDLEAISKETIDECENMARKSLKSDVSNEGDGLPQGPSSVSVSVIKLDNEHVESVTPKVDEGITQVSKKIGEEIEMETVEARDLQKENISAGGGELAEIVINEQEKKSEIVEPSQESDVSHSLNEKLADDVTTDLSKENQTIKSKERTDELLENISDSGSCEEEEKKSDTEQENVIDVAISSLDVGINEHITIPNKTEGTVKETTTEINDEVKETNTVDTSITEAEINQEVQLIDKIESQEINSSNDSSVQQIIHDSNAEVTENSKEDSKAKNQPAASSTTCEKITDEEMEISEVVTTTEDIEKTNDDHETINESNDVEMRTTTDEDKDLIPEANDSGDDKHVEESSEADQPISKAPSEMSDEEVPNLILEPDDDNVNKTEDQNIVLEMEEQKSEETENIEHLGTEGTTSIEITSEIKEIISETKEQNAEETKKEQEAEKSDSRNELASKSLEQKDSDDKLQENLPLTSETETNIVQTNNDEVETNSGRVSSQEDLAEKATAGVSVEVGENTESIIESDSSELALSSEKPDKEETEPMESLEPQDELSKTAKPIISVETQGSKESPEADSDQSEVAGAFKQDLAPNEVEDNEDMDLSESQKNSVEISASKESDRSEVALALDKQDEEVTEPIESETKEELVESVTSDISSKIVPSSDKEEKEVTDLAESSENITKSDESSEMSTVEICEANTKDRTVDIKDDDQEMADSVETFPQTVTKTNEEICEPAESSSTELSKKSPEHLETSETIVEISSLKEPEKVVELLEKPSEAHETPSEPLENPSEPLKNLSEQLENSYEPLETPSEPLEKPPVLVEKSSESHVDAKSSDPVVDTSAEKGNAFSKPDEEAMEVTVSSELVVQTSSAKEGETVTESVTILTEHTESFEMADKTSPVEGNEEAAEYVEEPLVIPKTTEELKEATQEPSTSIKLNDEDVGKQFSVPDEAIAEEVLNKSPEDTYKADQEIAQNVPEEPAPNENVTADVTEQDEAALAIANLEDMENNIPSPTEKEKQDMEVLRQAVESITDSTAEDVQKMDDEEQSILVNSAVSEESASKEVPKEAEVANKNEQEVVPPADSVEKNDTSNTAEINEADTKNDKQEALSEEDSTSKEVSKDTMEVVEINASKQEIEGPVNDANENEASEGGETDTKSDSQEALPKGSGSKEVSKNTSDVGEVSSNKQEVEKRVEDGNEKRASETVEVSEVDTKKDGQEALSEDSASKEVSKDTSQVGEVSADEQEVEGPVDDTNDNVASENVEVSEADTKIDSQEALPDDSGSKEVSSDTMEIEEANENEDIDAPVDNSKENEASETVELSKTDTSNDQEALSEDSVSKEVSKNTVEVRESITSEQEVEEPNENEESKTMEVSKAETKNDSPEELLEDSASRRVSKSTAEIREANENEKQIEELKEKEASETVEISEADTKDESQEALSEDSSSSSSTKVLKNSADVGEMNENEQEVILPVDDSNENEASETVEVSEADTKNCNKVQTSPNGEVSTTEIIENNDVCEKVLPDSSQSISDTEAIESVSDSKVKPNERPRRHKKINDSKSEESNTSLDLSDKEKSYSPKVTIKPIKVPDEEVSTTSNSEAEAGKGSLKMTITKQSDKMHSILKVSEVEQTESGQEQEEPLPKLKIKSKPVEQPSIKMSTRSSRQAHQTSNSTQRSSSPRITIKPLVKPETLSPLKIKIGLKTDDSTKKHSPKLNIKPLPKPEEEPKEVIQSPRKVVIKNIVKPTVEEEEPTARKVIIKNVVKTSEDEEQTPKITIKPIPKPESDKEVANVSPKLNIKPIKKPEEEENDSDKISPKITIKPIIKPVEPDSHSDEIEDETKKRIVLKINKGNLPAKESRKREHPPDDDKAEKLAKITVKFSKEGGHPHIVQQPEETQQKRPHEDPNHLEKNKKQKLEAEAIISTRSKQKDHVEAPTETKKNNPTESLSENNENTKTKLQVSDNPGHGLRGKHKDSISNSPIETKRSKLRDSKHKDSPDTKKLEEAAEGAVAGSPVTALEDSGTGTPGNPGPNVTLVSTPDVSFSTPGSEINTPVVTPQPRKRGRPRKIPLEQRPGMETPPPKVVETPPTPTESGRPKRSCRGQSALDTLGLKPRKPRGSRGGGRGGARAASGESRSIPMKLEKEPKLSQARLKLMQKAISEAGTVNVISIGAGADKTVDIEDVLPQSQVEKKNVDTNVQDVVKVEHSGVHFEVETVGKKDINTNTNAVIADNTEQQKSEGRNLKAILQQAIKSKQLSDSKKEVVSELEIKKRNIEINKDNENVKKQKASDKIETVAVKSEGYNVSAADDVEFDSSEVKPEIVQEGQSKLEVSTNPNCKTSEEIGIPSSSTSPSQEPSEAMLVSDPVPHDASLPKSFGAGEDSLLLAPESSSVIHSTVSSTTGPSEVVMVDEETRMSADTNSRAQTPAKQIIPMDTVEESQSSVQSTATTESGKASSSRPSKAPRLEVQEPEGSIISPDQLAEYYWNGNGPYMLQEQVAHFLGIKSFKRKYPGIKRRMLEMQERDFIRESGLVSEHMCDLGLTAVNSADILDIMYSDFQDKYEEYCKHQRDRQTKELINKQKALSLAASQEKSKADLTENAKQSAAQWNATFNKTRREQRRACMDLQTYTVHFPKGRMKQFSKGKIGNYPVSLVPGQFTDYYKELTPTEINNLPLNTLCYEPVDYIRPEVSTDSGSDGSDSDSDSSSSSSDSDSSSSSSMDDCKLCKHSPKKVVSPTATK